MSDGEGKRVLAAVCIIAECSAGGTLLHSQACGALTLPQSVRHQATLCLVNELTCLLIYSIRITAAGAIAGTCVTGL